MGSETIKLPFINFSELDQESQNPNWESVKDQVKFALQEFGCFEATFDQIPQNLRNSVFEGLKQLFDLPLQIKLRNRSNKPYHGYVGQYAMVPLYESLGIDSPQDLGSIENFTNLMWSEGNSDFRIGGLQTIFLTQNKLYDNFFLFGSKSIQSFSEQLSALDQIVRKIVLESLGLEKYIDEHIESTNYLVRVQKYDCPKGNEAEIGLTSHTDKNILTILYQNEVKGLEVQTKDGKWITVEPSPNSFIVMTGEAFHAWTNGRLHSAYHRVTMQGSVARYSIGLFSVPKEGYIIKAPEEMVDEEHPLLFKPFDHVKFLDFYYSEAGQRSPAALKAYCGA